MKSKNIFKILIPIFIFLILISSAFADGGFWVKPQDTDIWNLHSEEQQFCAINYKNGYQNMILNIGINPELNGEKAVWIFPIPAEPEQTIIDIVKDFPKMSGYDIKDRVDRDIKDAFSMIRLTQIYTFPVLLTGSIFMTAGIKGLISESFIDVHEHIEEYGLTTELITAKDSTAFWNYLALKELAIPESSKAVFNDYIGKEYSFVVSWISDVEEFKKEKGFDRVYEEYEIYKEHRPQITFGEYLKTTGHYWREGITIGVEVDFPTDKIYYPLIPTSVYGSKRVPAVIYVMDHVIPEFYPNIEKDSTVTYYYQRNYYVPAELENFFFNQPVIKDLSYTKITLDPPSKLLTEDLWMELGAPASIKLANCIMNNLFWFGLIFMIICSMLASVLSALIIFRKDRLPLWKFTLWGLWNMLTLLGFIIATIFLKTKPVDAKLKKQLKTKGMKIVAKDTRKIAYVILFTVIFLILTGLFQVIWQAIL